jgi:hypothetical protein
VIIVVVAPQTIVMLEMVAVEAAIIIMEITTVIIKATQTTA